MCPSAARPTAALVAVLLAAAPARAQVRLGVDASYSTDYWWHGMMRSSGRVAQGGAWASVGTPALRVAAGGWANVELGHATPGGFEERPGRGANLSEVDGWIEAAGVLEHVDARVGLVWYDYGGRGPAARRTGADDTREVYGRVTLPRAWLTPSVALWQDTRRARGAFVEASLTAPTGLVPLRANLDLILAAGFSLGQERNPAVPSQTFVSARKGLTYAQLAALANVSIGNVALRLGPRLQLNTDSVTRQIGPARNTRLRAWLEAGGGCSFTLGGRR